MPSTDFYMNTYKRKHPIFHKALCTFLPERCPYCDKLINSGALFCNECKESFSTITYRTYAKGGFPCISATPFTANFAEAIKRFKFSNRRQYAFSLACAMADAITKEYAEEEFDYIVYVPIHKIKKRERGYNQSRLLAKNLSYILEIPVADVLVKVRNNETQHTIIHATKRAENVKGAFKVTCKETIKDKRILLIDDIITTGSTLGECARVLYKCKPASIHCATFALTISKTT